MTKLHFVAADSTLKAVSVINTDDATVFSPTAKAFMPKAADAALPLTFSQQFTAPTYVTVTVPDLTPPTKLGQYDLVFLDAAGNISGQAYPISPSPAGGTVVIVVPGQIIATG